MTVCPGRSASESPGRPPVSSSSGSARKARKVALLFTVGLFGYPLVGMLGVLLGVESQAASVPFRLAVAAASVWLLLRHAPSMRIRLELVAVVVFWVGYLLRLMHDLKVAGIDSALYAVQFFLAGCALPALACACLGRQWSEVLVAKRTLLLSAGACFVMLAGHWSGAFGAADLTEATGRLALTTVNSITLGQGGVTAVIAAIVLLRIDRRWRWVCLAAAIIGAMTVVLTATKGALVTLLVCLGVLALRSNRLRPAILTTLAVATLGLVLAGGEAMVERFATLADDRSTMERVEVLGNSFRQIADAPLLGSAYVELQTRMYPHNFIVEAVLAVGLPLALLLVLLSALAALKAWRLMAAGTVFLPLLYFQALTVALISGALFAASAFWVTMVLILNTDVRPWALREGGPVRRMSNGRVSAAGARFGHDPLSPIQE